MIEMDWEIWRDKKVFIRTKHNKFYTGKVIGLDLDHLPIIWIVIRDKYNLVVQLSAEEIAEIREERYG